MSESKLYVYRKFFCKSPTKTSSNKWRMFCFLYEVSIWANDAPSNFVGFKPTTEYYTHEDILFLKLQSESVHDYKEIMAATDGD